MKGIRWLLAALVALGLTLTAGQSLIGKSSEQSGVFFNEESLVEGKNTTFTAVAQGPHLVSSFLIEDRDLRQQAKESTIIVKGRVVNILGTVRTEDMAIPQNMRVHTDVVFQVDQYLGPVSLPFTTLILRRPGGKIDGFTHIVHQENLTVGEELVIFRLTRPDFINQIPAGYCLEQYFLFNPASKFIKIGDDQYRASYADRVYSLTQMNKECQAKNK